jgi:predicted AlkP superfamily pyrophosphatase or phosphodiesterase
MMRSWDLGGWPRLGLLLALGFAVSGCADDGVGERGRVLLVGIDGATLRIAKPMLEEGRLPNLARIAGAGIYGPLRSHFPLSSPRIWTSIATGKLPENHGILGFAWPDEAGVQRLFQSDDRSAHALWNIVSDAGLTVGVVNWWNTYPLEKVRGFVASDHLLPFDVRGRMRMTGAVLEDLGPIVHPPEWGERVAALLGEETPLTRDPDPFADTDSFSRWVKPERLTTRYENDASLVRIARAVEAEWRPDLMMVFLPGIDRISHVIWAGVEPAELYPNGPFMAPAKREAAGRALRDYYAYTDALIGLLMESYGPEDLVIVVSDHGFEAGRGLGVLTGVHESVKALHGVVFARGRDVAPAPGAVSVNDIAPTILAWLGIPVGEDMDGDVAPFLHGVVASRIASHDTTPIERLDDVPSGAEDALLEQLRALGYLEAHSEPSHE